MEREYELREVHEEPRVQKDVRAGAKLVVRKEATERSERIADTVKKTRPRSDKAGPKAGAECNQGGSPMSNGTADQAILAISVATARLPAPAAGTRSTKAIRSMPRSICAERVKTLLNDYLSGAERVARKRASCKAPPASRCVCEHRLAPVPTWAKRLKALGYIRQSNDAPRDISPLEMCSV
jgi:hypothetical protein